MRLPRMLTALSTTTLLFGSARAALANQAPVKVEVSTPATHTVWYTDPMWLGVGAVAVLIILVLAIMASRKSEPKSTTTVIR
jgi:formate-dependent nitrite reductase membrane component NrfD